MRKYFIARAGYALVDADYSQIELRLLAHIADDYHMIEAFKSGEDIHRKTAAAVFGIPEEDNLCLIHDNRNGLCLHLLWNHPEKVFSYLYHL